MHIVFFKIFVILTFFLCAPSLSVANDILRAQKLLSELGYELGNPDGIIGSMTKNALKQYSRDRGMIFDGVIDYNEIENLTYSVKQQRSRNLVYSNITHGAILPKKPNNFDYLPCIYEENLGFADIKKILKEQGHQKLDGHGPDREGFFTINHRVEMFHAELWANPTPVNVKKVKELYSLLFDSQYASGPYESITADSLPVRQFTQALMYTFHTLKENGQIDDKEEEIFLREIQRRIASIELAIENNYTMRGCQVGTKEGFHNCQNHTYGTQLVRTLYGAITGLPNEFQRGEKIYKFAIDDLEPDGALWREAIRGKWSWKYYNHGLHYLLAIAEIYRLNGQDLYSYRSPISGKTIHDAVSFYLNAIENPELMWEYASENYALESYMYLEGWNDFTSDEILYRIIGETEFSGAKSWFYIYRSVFKDHPNTARADQLIPTFQEQTRGSNDLGFFAQCIYKDANQKTNFKDHLPTKTTLIERFDRSKPAMIKKINCLNTGLDERGNLPTLSSDEIEFFSVAFENDQNPKNKRNLISAGLPKEKVEKIKRYLLRLVNFTGTVDEFCSRPIK